MKRIVFAAFAAICTLVGFTDAFAVGPPVGIFQRYETLRWRARVAANDPSLWDSTATMRVGAAGASSVLDTSLAVSTEGWALPASLGTTDSLQFMHVLIYDIDGASCESGADSLACAVQVSADGNTWATTLTFKGGTAASTITSRNNQTIVSGTFLDDISLNGAALAAGAPIWSFRYKQRPVTTLGGAVDIGGLLQWPFVRFILSFHDAKGYKVYGKVGHYQAVNP
jgi:hypothetical protein